MPAGPSSLPKILRKTTPLSPVVRPSAKPGPYDGPAEERRLRIELGDAPAGALAPRRRAAPQLRLSGRADEGLPLLRTTLGAAGLGLAGPPRPAVWARQAARPSQPATSGAARQAVLMPQVL